MAKDLGEKPLCDCHFYFAVKFRVSGILLAALFFVAMVPKTYADSEQKPSPVKLFLDRNKDGFISLDELSQTLAERKLKNRDLNKDQSLSENEIQKNKPPVSKPSPVISFSEADINKDKKLTAEELKQATKKSPRVRFFFDSLDKDHNNLLDRRELGAIPEMDILRIEF
jgi:Ca2+-binding EF-hand superfamily protein